MTLALPLHLQGDEIFDTNGVSIALVRGLMPEYRERGEEIVTAVNAHADLLAAAKFAVKVFEDPDVTCYGQTQPEIDAAVALQDAIAKAEQI